MLGKKIDEKKNYIARKAIDVFSSRGYKESSLQDVAVRAKLSKAGIYHYFKSKSDLLAYIVLKNTDKGICRLRECLSESLSDNPDRKQVFEKLIRVYGDEVLSRHKESLLVLRERHQITGRNKKVLTEKERELFRLIRDTLGQVVNRNKKINLNLASFQIMSMLHWMGYWFNEKGTLSKQEAIDQTIYLIFHGILESKNS